MAENNYCVYIHINKINNKKYVGITKTSLKKRWGKDGNQYVISHKSVFGRAVEKYGWDNFEHQIFTSDISKEHACALEVLLIGVLRTRDKRYGYNVQQGGQLGNAGIVFSEESKEKMREAKKGKRLTEEHKRHISESLQGHEPGNWTEESRNKLRLANIGKTIPIETRQKISDSSRGIPKSEEHKKNIKLNHANTIPIFCFELNETFCSINEAEVKYNIKNIDKCLSGERKSAGKHPVTGEKLHWVKLKK